MMMITTVSLATKAVTAPPSKPTEYTNAKPNQKGKDCSNELPVTQANIRHKQTKYKKGGLYQWRYKYTYYL